ncbi:UNKNOWN [Stylonychia lemnae]|uniref:Uncharacterized protein n=1 Tax=Stylonychia lemnae TaxID=5949 RepID=A0A077ZZ26_STYLE|nr:UNKNOWN [Stylonychia lemnae]|eukprot:CDW74822.1 UNKNOWN [Stylonychia lemnae]
MTTNQDYKNQVNEQLDTMTSTPCRQQFYQFQNQQQINLQNNQYQQNQLQTQQQQLGPYRIPLRQDWNVNTHPVFETQNMQLYYDQTMNLQDSAQIIGKVNEIAIGMGFKVYRHSEDCKINKKEQSLILLCQQYPQQRCPFRLIYCRETDDSAIRDGNLFGIGDYRLAKYRPEHNHKMNQQILNQTYGNGHLTLNSNVKTQQIEVSEQPQTQNGPNKNQNSQKPNENQENQQVLIKRTPDKKLSCMTKNSQNYSQKSNNSQISNKSSNRPLPSVQIFHVQSTAHSLDRIQKKSIENTHEINQEFDENQSQFIDQQGSTTIKDNIKVKVQYDSQQDDENKVDEETDIENENEDDENLDDL